MCSLCCLCTYPATPISNRPPAMCGQHEPPVRPAAPRFEIRKCSLEQAKGKNKTGLPTSSKWQIGLFLWYKPYRGGCGLPQGERSVPLRGVPRGDTPLGDSLVTFSSGRKSPGCRAERLHRWAQGLCPCRTPRGAEHGKAMLSRSARISGGAGTASPA